MTVFSFSIMAICGWLCISALISRKLNKSLLTIPAIAGYCILIAFRGTSGSDTIVYAAVLNGSIPVTVFHEVGFQLLVHAIRSVNGGISSLEALQAIICFISLLHISRRNGGAFVALYISLFGINLDFSTMRESIALHLVSIIFMLTKRNSFFLATPSLIHIPALSVLLNRKLSWVSQVFLAIAAIMAYSVIARYIEYGSEFLFRGSSAWVIQEVSILAVLWFMGFRFRFIFIASILLVIPVGYRALAYLYILQRPRASRKIYQQVAIIIVALISVAKVVSFERQSIIANGARSVALHFGYM